MSGVVPATERESSSKSRSDEARAIAERSLDELTQQLESGNSRQLDAYLAAMSRFHHYSFGNIMMIVSQKPDATQVAGFHTWRSLGRAVKRGEKGIAIFAPMMVRLKEKRSTSPETEENKDAPRQLRFRVVFVFDVSQTEGEPLPEPAKAAGDPGEFLTRLEDAVRASGVVLEDSDSLGGAYGVSKGGRIEVRTGLTPAERFSVLVHEWAHEILHQVDKENRPSKTVRETEAEAVAFVVGNAIGIESRTASADYIRLYRGNKDTLAASLDRIQQTASRIIESITGSAGTQCPQQTNTVPAIACEYSRQR